MMSYRAKLLCTTGVALFVGSGVALAASPVATSANGVAALPMAQPQPMIQLAACNPCNPCAANPCNPCAAAACNPCNPCAAAACNPCNPCAAGAAGVSSKCVVPRLAALAAANPCNPRNPCAAKNPCNPCAAAACNPCNPCAAKNPCNPCAAGEAPELTAAEASAAWDCILPEATAAWGKSGNALSATFAGWPTYATQPYVSDTHGGRYVQNFANGVARNYGKFEEAGTMAAGAKLGKPSMTISAAGGVGVGPLFLMEKMPAGFNTASFDWRYTMIMPDGSIFGTTNGANAAGVQFCVDCHSAVAEDQDNMFFLPEELRVVSN